MYSFSSCCSLRLFASLLPSLFADSLQTWTTIDKHHSGVGIDYVLYVYCMYPTTSQQPNMLGSNYIRHSLFYGQSIIIEDRKGFGFFASVTGFFCNGDPIRVFYTKANTFPISNCHSKKCCRLLLFTRPLTIISLHDLSAIDHLTWMDLKREHTFALDFLRFSPA